MQSCDRPNTSSQPLFFRILGILCILWSAPSVFAQSRPVTIAIIQPYDLKEYHEAVEGFVEELRARLQRDFTTVVYESAQDLLNARRTLKGSPVNLILSVGTDATTEVAQMIDDIPVVFTMVLDPAPILSDHPDLVGVAINIPLDIQFRMLQQILPAAKRIGILYDPVWNAELVQESIQATERLGLTIQAIPVASQKDIADALKQISQQADVLWGITDSTVYTSQTARFIIQDTAMKYKIPFIGPSESYVKAGALYALFINVKDIGRQSAELASQILSDPTGTQKRTVQPETVRLSLNLRTADLIGVKIPEYLVHRADVVYE